MGMPQPALPFEIDDAPVNGASAPNVVTRRAPGLTAVPPAAPDTSHPRGGPVFARHPSARRYVVRVKLDGSVRVTIPRWGTAREARAFLEQQQAWVEKQQRRMTRERSVPNDTLPVERQRELRARAKSELPERLLAMAHQLGVAVARVSVRNQRWRWGSCSRRGHICLNWRLMAMPDWVRDYVLIHELMHLKRMDHSPKFWKLVSAACPVFQDARAWLRTHQSLLDPRV